MLGGGFFEGGAEVLNSFSAFMLGCDGWLCFDGVLIDVLLFWKDSTFYSDEVCRCRMCVVSKDSENKWELGDSYGQATTGCSGWKAPLVHEPNIISR